MTALSLAVSKGFTEIVKILLDAKAEANIEALNMVSGKIETPLITAIKLGDIDMIKMLLDNGADVDAKDYEGKDAMEWAREKGLESILNL